MLWFHVGPPFAKLKVFMEMREFHEITNFHEMSSSSLQGGKHCLKRVARTESTKSRFAKCLCICLDCNNCIYCYCAEDRLLMPAVSLICTGCWGASQFWNTRVRSLVTQVAASLGPRPYLLGLLAMIKCSICSYQCDNWYVSNWRLACHIYFSMGAVSSRACSEALMCCTGLAHCQAQHTLLGNNFDVRFPSVILSVASGLPCSLHGWLRSPPGAIARLRIYSVKARSTEPMLSTWVAPAELSGCWGPEAPAKIL